MDASSRADDARLITGRGRGTRALTIMCWAQVLMVVANLYRLPVLSTADRSFPITVTELSLGAMLIAGALVIWKQGTLHVDRVALMAIGFVVIGGGSAVVSVQRFNMSLFDLMVALSYLGRWVTYFCVYIVVMNAVREDDVDTLWGAVELMIVIFAVFGAVQSAFLPNFAQIVYPESREYVDWDPQGHRLVSTVLEPNIAGSMLMIVLLVQVARVSVGAAVSRWRLLAVFVGFTLTLSRSAALGIIAGMAVIVAAHGLSRRLVRLGLITAALVLLFSPLLLQYALAYHKFDIGSGTSAAARLTNWLLVLRIVADYPLFGVGFNAYKFASQQYGAPTTGPSSYGADGGLLFIMGMTGIVGVLVYCTMLGQVIARSRSLWRDLSLSPSHRGLAIGAAAVAVSVAVASISVNAILTTWIMEMSWVIWGLTFVIARARDARAREAALAQPRPPRIVALAA